MFFFLFSNNLSALLLIWKINIVKVDFFRYLINWEVFQIIYRRNPHFWYYYHHLHYCIISKSIRYEMLGNYRIFQPNKFHINYLRLFMQQYTVTIYHDIYKFFFCTWNKSISTGLSYDSWHYRSYFRLLHRGSFEVCVWVCVCDENPKFNSTVQIQKAKITFLLVKFVKLKNY